MLTIGPGLAFTPTTRHDTYSAIDLDKADLSGKVVLVTEASKGVGKALAVAVAQAGALGLVLFARSDFYSTNGACFSTTQAGQSLNVLTLAVDITNNQEVIAAAKRAGWLDVVINNAALFEAAYQVTRAVIPLLTKSKGDKTILNSTSLAAAIVAPAMSSYCISKLAVLRFTEFINAEYGYKGVVAYSEQPGSIPIDMTSLALDEIKHMIVDTMEIPETVATVASGRNWKAGT
ncbi:hypothetical protein PHLGIDRAFT_116775 [Phlebiopsis gigantea 11061_1 CR5-6]|uniref:Ketoreductase (KR) domain-containing protein n=1 Tax=Phlebiopsis gigantea (strain 11061_1 CR5-6) TaxID=745531 RepID=A0A0C3S1M8_PHLG1|nr:hypothetical protein PHLGIDRAFT_116775 [Phlebiopsis gigantea 11061_1 CR5-6]